MSDAHVFCDAEDDGWRQCVGAHRRLTGPIADLDDPRSFGTGIVDQALEPGIMPLVDDGSIVFTPRPVRIEGRHFPIIRPDKRVDVVFVDECVIGGDARLTGVEQLTESNGRRRLVKGDLWRR